MLILPAACPGEAEPSMAYPPRLAGEVQNGISRWKGNDLAYAGACDANGVIHISPGQRPGFIAPFNILAGQRPASSHRESRFQRLKCFLPREPRALPWADMTQAVGLKMEWAQVLAGGAGLAEEDVLRLARRSAAAMEDEPASVRRKKVLEEDQMAPNRRRKALAEDQMAPKRRKKALAEDQMAPVGRKKALEEHALAPWHGIIFLARGAVTLAR